MANGGSSRQRLPLLEHFEVVAEEFGMVRSLSGPVSCGDKEPAGKAFHEAVLRQAGLLGARARACCFFCGGDRGCFFV